MVIENSFVNDLADEWGAKGDISRFLILDRTGGGKYLKEMLDQSQARLPISPGENVSPSLDDLAYILYTSGSTGKPKGVMLTNRAAISFVDWCSEAFGPDLNDRFSSHAPFHFDLSILDIYLPIKHGASLVLISEEIGKDPARLAAMISESNITSWYSTPSILSFLAQYGRLERYDYSSLRMVHFAGEVFPVKHLRALKKMIPNPRYFNLYGPTETNVCTFYEIPPIIPEDRTHPFPIGKACSRYRIGIFDEFGREVPPGNEGELCASGDGMMIGYWNLPERTANAFLADSSGGKWYKTGDITFEGPDGNYVYVARRDRMVKKRGYRIELGEIEAGLYRHPAIKEAAVVALQDASTSGHCCTPRIISRRCRRCHTSTSSTWTLDDAPTVLHRLSYPSTRNFTPRPQSPPAQAAQRKYGDKASAGGRDGPYSSVPIVPAWAPAPEVPDTGRWRLVRARPLRGRRASLAPPGRRCGAVRGCWDKNISGT